MLESLLVLVLVGFSSAHICSIEPPQRGGFSIGQAGDPSCYRRVDCSSQPAGPVTRTYTAGSTVTLLVQQNLNHFSAFFGGYIDVALAPSPSNLTFTTLAWRNDFVGHEQVLQTNYSLQVTMPSTPSPHAVLRVRYVSNNPDEIDPPANVQAIFWQCADVAIVSGAPQQPPAASPLPQFPAAAIHRETAVLRAQSSSGCCAPTTFQMTGQEHNPTGTSSSYAVYWDAVNQRTRIDKNSTAGPPLTMWNLYGAQKEYVLNHITGKCELYGPDAFYSWVRAYFFPPVLLPLTHVRPLAVLWQLLQREELHVLLWHH